MEIYYKHLLRKYIQFIIELEGTDYIEDVLNTKVQFSAEELAKLEELSNEANTDE